MKENQNTPTKPADKKVQGFILLKDHTHDRFYPRGSTVELSNPKLIENLRTNKIIK